MTVTPLTIEGQPFTHVAVIKAADLTETTAATAQTIDLATNLPAGSTIEAYGGALKLVTPFKDASDAAFNSTAVTIGTSVDTGVNNLLTSTELNENGTEVDYARFVNTAPVTLTVATTDLQIVFNAMSGKALNDIDTGEVHVFFALTELNKLGKAID